MDYHVTNEELYTTYLLSHVRGRSIGCASAWYADDRGFDPTARQHSFLEIGREIISRDILFLPMIQEGQLSVTDESITETIP